jgi:hypothetical protein
MMRLTTAHKILIATAVLFFAGYALWELRRYAQTADVGALWRSVAAGLGAVGLGLYLRAFVRSLRQ